MAGVAPAEMAHAGAPARLVGDHNIYLNRGCLFFPFFFRLIEAETFDCCSSLHLCSHRDRHAYAAFVVRNAAALRQAACPDQHKYEGDKSTQTSPTRR
jgi:hypothetical protein